MSVRPDMHRAGAGRDEHCLALADGKFASGVVTERGGAFRTYIYDKGIQLRVVAVHVFRQIVERGRKVGRRDEFDWFVRVRGVVCAVVSLHGVVDGIACPFCMQFAQLAVVVAAVVVIDSVGDVACLLDFSDEGSGPDAMDASGRDMEDVAGLELVEAEHVFDASVSDTAFIFFRTDGMR